MDVWRLLLTDHVFENSSCTRWSKDSAEHLFQNMWPNLWNAYPIFWNTWPSFWNTLPSFWGFERKLKAQPRVWKAWPRVCVITRPMLSQSATVKSSTLICMGYTRFWTLPDAAHCQLKIGYSGLGAYPERILKKDWSFIYNPTSNNLPHEKIFTQKVFHLLLCVSKREFAQIHKN